MSEEGQQRKLEQLKAIREYCGVITKLCYEFDAVIVVESFNTDPSNMSKPRSSQAAFNTMEDFRSDWQLRCRLASGLYHLYPRSTVQSLCMSGIAGMH